MEKLPTPLICLTIQHVIDDVDAVEGLLRENPNAANCMPLALMEVLKMPRIPDAKTTLKYLQVLWDGSLDVYGVSMYNRAARNGLIYLLPYLERAPYQSSVNSALSAAAENGHLDVVEYLLNVPVFMGTSLLTSISMYAQNYDAIDQALKHAAENGHTHIIAYLLSLLKDYPAFEDTVIIARYHAIMGKDRCTNEECKRRYDNVLNLLHT